MNSKIPFVSSTYICRGCRARGYALLVHSQPFSTSSRAAASGKDKTPKPVSLATRETQLRPTSKYSGSFPRWSLRAQKGTSLLTAAQFCSDQAAPWDRIQNGEIMRTKTCTVHGRVIAHRNFGNKLAFLTLRSGGATAQVLISANDFSTKDAPVTEAAIFAGLQEFRKTVKKGDYIAVTGHPSRGETKSKGDTKGQETMRATQIPKILSPSLEVLPYDTTNPEVLMRNRHLDMLLHPKVAEPLVVRHHVLQTFRNFFNSQGYVEVSTPLIVAGAGGAAARPFDTEATEFPETRLNLRVAPELWLKRLIIGGMEKIYEIGPAFRNEGVDNTHNPEFTICEFYRVMLSLEELIKTTESLFHRLARDIQSYKTESNADFPDILIEKYEGPYARLDFIPTLEREMQAYIPGWKCPDLSRSKTALSALLDTFEPLQCPVPAARTLPTLLDALAARLIEPLCQDPTFITHHPECMSPLAKSFLDTPTTTEDVIPTIDTEPRIRHRISARAELFIRGREYVNCYEEENSPVAQRRKFVQQLEFREQAVVQSRDGGSNSSSAADDHFGANKEVDESYLSALEWGMPPTGGWGCGIDRIVMLFSDRSRIADVLPFGTLRNVVGLGVGVDAHAKKTVVSSKRDGEEERDNEGDKGKTLEGVWKEQFAS